MRVFWDERLARIGTYELRAHPAAMLLKLRKMSGGSWIVNCLGEASELSSKFNDTEAKNAAIAWMLPILERLRNSLESLH